MAEIYERNEDVFLMTDLRQYPGESLLPSHRLIDSVTKIALFVFKTNHHHKYTLIEEYHYRVVECVEIKFRFII